MDGNHTSALVTNNVHHEMALAPIDHPQQEDGPGIQLISYKINQIQGARS